MKDKSVNIFKKFYTGFVDAFRGIFMHIPITFCVIVLFNIFVHIMAFLEEHRKTGEYLGFNSFVTYMVVFSVFWALGTFLTEIAVGARVNNEIPEQNFENITIHQTIFNNKMILKMSGIITSAAVAFFIAYKLLGYFLMTGNEIYTLFNNDVTDRVAAHVAGYVIVIICISLYICINKSKKTFFEYAMSIFVKYFQIYIVSVVTLIGSALIIAIIYTLFVSSSDNSIWEFYAHICLFIGGMYALPFAVYALIKPECEISRFMEILVKYVMHIISLIAYVIIYIYMVKILIMREIPSNSIFEICTALFVCSMVIAIMCLSFEVKGFLQKAAANLPYVFIPFIILQVYSVFARIRQYGVTPSRYMGVVFIVFDILYIVIYTICKTHNNPAEDIENPEIIAADNIENNSAENIENTESTAIDETEKNTNPTPTMQLIFIIIAALTVITTFIPGINVLTLSKNSQVKILNKYVSEKDNSPSDELIKKAYGAAIYIKASDYGENLLNKLISNDDFEKLNEMRDKLIINGSYPDNERRIYGSVYFNEADISGYNKIYLVDSYENKWYDDEVGIIDLKNLVIKTEAGGDDPICYHLDMSEQFEKYKEVASENEDVVFPHYDNTLPLSDDAKLYITNLNIRYTEDNGETIIKSLSIGGYVFAK